MVPSAPGEGDKSLADISMPSAKLLTTPLPQSTGEQTNPLGAKQTLQLTSGSPFYACVRTAILLAGQLKGLHAVTFTSHAVPASTSVNL